MKPKNDTAKEFRRAIKIATRMLADEAAFALDYPRWFMPLENERFKHVLLPLNLYAKPLGLTYGAPSLPYCCFVDQAYVFDEDPRSFDNVWLDKDHLVLYRGAKSLFDYFERLDRLFSHRNRKYCLISPLAHDQRTQIGRVRVVPR